MSTNKKIPKVALCSFCGKKNTEVSKLIAGPGVYICNECVVICCGVLSKEMSDWPKHLRPEDDPLRKAYSLLSAMHHAKEISDQVYHSRLVQAVESEFSTESVNCIS